MIEAASQAQSIAETKSSYDFSDVTLGDGDGDAVVLIHWRKTDVDAALSSLTIGGQQATILAANLGDATQHTAVAYLSGVSAGSVAVNATFSDNTDRLGLTTWTLSGAAPAAANWAQALTTLDTTIDATQGGALLGIAVQASAAATNIDWTGITERAEWQAGTTGTYGHGSADQIITADETARPVSATTDGNPMQMLVVNVPAA